ncbi:MucR family transcriptional regulator [Kribbella sp. NPDC023972]|uniref:MucR family transcriptional regulator n=1 Tax=Kribbella sp. NPDC023972 TaxID=3154795 RepID=UPI00340614AE
MRLGDVDGHGRHGMLEETDDGLVCHECGRAFPNLGLHAWRGHGMTAAQYREKHGLQRRRGLVSSELRTRIRTNATARMATPAGQAFAAARDPQRAQDARLTQSLGWRAAAHATSKTARTGLGRLGTEVTCQNPACGAVFCPLASARKRRFCTRSCASVYNRNVSRAGSGGSSAPAATPT